MGSTLLDDVTVPLGQIPALLEEIPHIADTYGVTVGAFGHAGDGSMHPTIVYDSRGRSSAEWARHAFAAIVALALRGTVTGKHGDGILESESLRSELARTEGCTGQ
jgi:glycolate oxidase